MIQTDESLISPYNVRATAYTVVLVICISLLMLRYTCVHKYLHAARKGLSLARTEYT